ncbi:MAG: VOC family protein [Armatimonadetes bacterium]|nr:VOC family protein [Armatimonadota bacterium]
MNLNQVTVACSDVARSVAFYKRLGLQQIVDSPHYARFACPVGGATFSVHLAPDGVVSSTTVVYFEVEELDVVVGELQSAGVAFDQLPQDERWLWREARLRDPDGNQICLYWAGENRLNPPWRID